MDRTIARVLGVLLARLVFDGWTPSALADWAKAVATEVGKPQDADTMACPTCGQTVAEE
jgi:hypothetical protein